MDGMRRGRRSLPALGILGGLVVCLGAACGGSGKTTSRAVAQTTTAATTPAAEKAQIERVWTEFFAASTPARQRVSLLQDGSRFAAAIAAQSKSPLAAKSSATVSSVALEGPAKARVVYAIDLAGKPALPHQTGTAVRQGGSWKVGDRSFCGLLALGGAPPAACKA